jgi:hypothetical protein
MARPTKNLDQWLVPRTLYEERLNTPYEPIDDPSGEPKPLTPGEIADITGMNRMAVWRLETRALRTASVGTLERYLAGLGLGLRLVVVESDGSAVSRLVDPKPSTPVDPPANK